MHRSGIAPGDGAAACTRCIASCPASRRAGCTPTTATSATRTSTARAAASDAAFEPVARLRRELRARGLARAASGRRRHADVSRARAASGRRAEPRHLHLLGRGLRIAAAGPAVPARGARPDARREPPGPAAALPRPRAQGDRVGEPAPARAAAQSAGCHARDAQRGASRRRDAARRRASPSAMPVYGVPWHICPTVALYGAAVVIDGHRATGSWRVVARERALTV